jgi:hypothetical protein
MTQEYVKCLSKFSGVTVGEVYPIVQREENSFCLINDAGKQDVWWLADGEFELVDGPEEVKEESKATREMKFSTKEGSAVVHYKSGQTFHISYLTHMVVAGSRVQVTREYTQDGIEFSQTAYIPFEKFGKVICQAYNGELEITLSKDGKLSYPTVVEKKEMFFN